MLAYFGVTPEKLLGALGLSPEQAMELARRGIDWALPNLTLGALVIVPVWLVVYLFRPPRPRTAHRRLMLRAARRSTPAWRR